MSPIKLALRRFAILLLRKLVDAADHRLHAAEVKLRKTLPPAMCPPLDAPSGIKSRLSVARMTLHRPAGKLNPSAVKMAAKLKVSGMSRADAVSAMRNLGFSAKEVSAVFS